MSELVLNVYTDGSYSTTKKPDFTYGSYVIPEFPNTASTFCTNNVEAVRQRNVGGELLAAMSAIKFICIVADNVKADGDTVVCNLFFDYEGVGKWLTKEWRAKNLLTRGYVEYVTNELTKRDNIKLSLNHVKGHNGNEGNEKADRLAQEAHMNQDCRNMNDFIEEVLKLGR